MERLKKKLIAFGFGLWTHWVRTKRVLGSIGRPRLVLLDHVTLPVFDLAESLAFYRDVLGAIHLMTIDEEALKRFGRPPAPDNGEGAYHHSLFLGGATRVDLFLQSAGQPAPRRGHPHIAFRVPPRDMIRWKKKLDAHGVPNDGPIQLGFPGQASLYFNDPSGNHLEIVTTGFGQTIPVRPPEMGILERRANAELRGAATSRS